MNEVYYREEIKKNSLSINHRIALCDSLIKLLPPDDKAEIYLIKGKLLYDNGNFKNAGAAFSSGLLLCSDKNLSLKCALLYNAALAFFIDQSLNKSVNLQLKLLDIQKPDSLRYYDIKAHILIANILKSMQGKNTIQSQELQLNAALKLYNKLNKFIDKKISKELMANIYGGYGTINMVKGNYDYALENLKKAIATTDDPLIKASFKVNLGYIYERLGNLSRAEELYKDLINMDRFHINTWVAIYHLAAMLQSSGKYNEALLLINNHSEKRYIISGSILEVAILDLQAQSHRIQGNYRAALDNTQKALLVRDSIASVRQSEYDKLIADDIVQRANPLSRDRLMAQTFRLRNIVIALSIALALISILAAWSIFKFIKSNKKNLNLQLIIKNDKIRNEQAIKTKQQELEKCNRELTSKILQLNQINHTIEQISVSGATSNEQKDENIADEIIKLKKDLKINQHLWEPFLLQFEKIHPSFYSNLSLLSSSLTPAEKRMCAFILLNMTTKEIAATTNRSPRTVECVKYNIRQKLSISGSTEVFMHTVANAQKEEILKIAASIRNQSAPKS